MKIAVSSSSTEEAFCTLSIVWQDSAYIILADIAFCRNPNRTLLRVQGGEKGPVFLVHMCHFWVVWQMNGGENTPTLLQFLPDHRLYSLHFRVALEFGSLGGLLISSSLLPCQDFSQFFRLHVPFQHHISFLKWQNYSLPIFSSCKEPTCSK